MGDLHLGNLIPNPVLLLIEVNGKISSKFSNTTSLLFDSLWSLETEVDFKYICKGISEGLLQQAQKDNLESFDSNTVQTFIT